MAMPKTVFLMSKLLCIKKFVPCTRLLCTTVLAFTKPVLAQLCLSGRLVIEDDSRGPHNKTSFGSVGFEWSFGPIEDDSRGPHKEVSRIFFCSFFQMVQTLGCNVYAKFFSLVLA